MLRGRVDPELASQQTFSQASWDGSLASPLPLPKLPARQAVASLPGGIVPRASPESKAGELRAIWYIQGVSDSYCFALTDRLQFFALTRSSLSHYFNSSDGQRMTWPKADATFVSVVVLTRISNGG